MTIDTVEAIEAISGWRSRQPLCCTLPFKPLSKANPEQILDFQDIKTVNNLKRQ